MGQHAKISVPSETLPSSPPHYGVLVGWTHSPCGPGINLKMQSAQSQAALHAGQIDAHDFLMTRNQALILARYLLSATGQTLDMPERRNGWRAVWSKVRGA